jgi:hypothetical protein
MKLGDLVGTTIKQLKRNSPEILTALGVSGVITTAYLAAKASFTASEVLQGTELPDDRIERIKEQVRHTWVLYVPAGISGAAAIVCIIAGTRAQAQKTAVAVAAYSLTERAFSDYKEKVVEQIGVNKERSVRDEIAQEKVAQNPPTAAMLVSVEGNVLCCELFSGRYFWSTMEKIKSAVNEINSRIVREEYVFLYEFYDLLHITRTDAANTMGWEDARLLELDFTAVMTDEEKPCMAFSYNYIHLLT